MKRRGSGKSGPVRYAMYLRCSTDDQAHGDYTTIDTQREYNTQYVAQKGGLLVREYSDEGKTGTNLKRPGWRELLADAQAGHFDAVCVTYMSRLARGKAFHVAEYQLEECGIAVEMVREKFTPDMAGHVNKEMTILMDGMYPKMVSQWTKAKQQQMFARGYFCGGRVPFGYQLEAVPSDGAGATGYGDKEPPKRLVPDPQTLPIVVEAFERFVATRNATVVVEYLRTVTDVPWSYSKATYLLKNQAYRGVARWGEHVNEAAHEPIVPEALWDAAQDIFDSGAENRARRPKRQGVASPHAYYLRGMVTCQHCGGTMTTADHIGRRAPVRYYECIQAVKFGAACPVKRINADMLHGAVIAEIQRMAAHPWRVRKVLEEVARQLPEASHLEADVALLAKRLK